MNKQISTNAKIVKNSLNDGHVKIKMATIGEVNDNGFLIKNNQSIKFPNKSYPLLFEHKHDLDSVIGTFKPIGIEGSDMMADAQITNPKALELVKSGALHSASIAYMMTDYDYDQSKDAIVVSSGYLIELSLVLDPADKSAQIINSTKEETVDMPKNDKDVDMEPTLQDVLDAIEAASSAITDGLAAVVDAINDKETDKDDVKDDNKDSSKDDIKDDIKDDNTDADEKENKPASNSRLEQLKKKWR